MLESTNGVAKPIIFLAVSFAMERLQNLTYDRFRELAADPSLSKYERIGFPDAYRNGYAPAILNDIQTKLTALSKPGAVIIDIGSGSSDLAFLLIEHCRIHDQRLVAIDSAEMLAYLPDPPHVSKQIGRFPMDCATLIEAYRGKADAVLAYSVFHYIFAEASIFSFLDSAVSLLARNGSLLIGDIPNISKRQRFFRSPQGVKFHEAFTGTTAPPPLLDDPIPGHIDDALLLGLIARYRNMGHEAFLLSQATTLPMANRREDLLITRV